ncbi:AAA family ATPase [Bradyrhizobium barranii subsp. barranii]|uniref:AAA family ATPase n=1 Tax=Bradyrhizobium barranii subsp. barranii TaxID=2823807 RepID=A0A7Z0QJU6_9BRAD|nr:AAA family ATPase [Bradyrhizobium barranii]UGX98444.1 AAA family ATPase [Bradyrhizobium barranii subsp. barranii]
MKYENHFEADIPAPDPNDPFPHTHPGTDDARYKAYLQETEWRRENRELDAKIVSVDAQPPPKPSKFRRTNTNDIMARDYPAIKWVVPGYISEGFLVLAGRQKLGKTWLAIDMALAVATGGVAVGSIDCEQGNVLYIDMENGPRRIQSRIKALYPDHRNLPDLAKLEWVTEAPQLGAGLIEELEGWRTSVPNPRFVIIDVLQRIKPAGSMARNAYENDYSAWAPLQEWATRQGIAVLGLHHTKKGGADDPLEALSGSNGLSACADTTLVLDSGQNGKTLYVRGRDVEEKETALLFAGGAWSIIGEAAEVRRSDERAQIIAALQDHGEPMTPAEIVAATGKPRVSIQRLLSKMAKAGEVHKVGKGRYWVEPLPPGNSGHTGNSKTFDPDIATEFDDEGVTGADDTGNSDTLAGKPGGGIFSRNLGPRPVRQIGETSHRHKCAHCMKRGETVELKHGFAETHVHQHCIDAWIVDYDERNKSDEG